MRNNDVQMWPRLDDNTVSFEPGACAQVQGGEPCELRRVIRSDLDKWADRSIGAAQLQYSFGTSKLPNYAGGGSRKDGFPVDSHWMYAAVHGRRVHFVTVDADEKCGNSRCGNTHRHAHTMQRMHEEDGNPGHSDKQTNSVDRCAAKNFERLRKLDQFEQIVEHGDNIDHLVNHLLHNRDKTPEQERRPPAVMVSPSLLEGAPPSPSWALGSPSWKSRHNNNDVTNKDGRNTNLDIDSSVRFVSQTD